MLLGMEGVLGRDGPADREEMLLALSARPYQHRESAYHIPDGWRIKGKQRGSDPGHAGTGHPRQNGASLPLVALRQESGGDALRESNES
ncbi:uncharacterized protein N7473_007204 [Penicillium subrubescens]|uniref:uncharacterized protein n=1 Tax=Penicillium subrubescens TaxID=1316194 RepID=UPI002544E0E6|nr:uncharacterized protein N7473_007204 [Penicillium subrubescens]KAJ5890976.1 hypothetical protein N7473_007204 [Penicillium subrubescens]